MDTPEKCTPSDPQSQTVVGGLGWRQWDVTNVQGKRSVSRAGENTRWKEFWRHISASVHPRFRRVFAKLSVHGCQETRFAPWESSVRTGSEGGHAHPRLRAEVEQHPPGASLPAPGTVA